MVRVITVDDVKNLIRKLTLKNFYLKLIERLQHDYGRWQDFEKAPRLAQHVPNGVLELMPVVDKDYFSYKYVNGHPTNPQRNQLTVVAMGMLADVVSGYPVFISEMTLLTALRTAATSALASRYLARKNSKVFGMIGTGAQSEFQVLAHQAIFPLESVRYFDVDAKAMEKFAKNLAHTGLKLIPCENAQSVIEGCDILTTATADKKLARILENHWVHDGLHINGIGGDCPGKTELDPEILKRAKVVIEFFEQTKHEGELQHLPDHAFHAELWEIIANKKSGRSNEQEITVFDSVGFALEDYSVLRLVYSLAEDLQIGHVLDMVPSLRDPKNLFSVLL